MHQALMTKQNQPIKLLLLSKLTFASHALPNIHINCTTAWSILKYHYCYKKRQPWVAGPYCKNHGYPSHYTAFPGHYAAFMQVVSARRFQLPSLSLRKSAIFNAIRKLISRKRVWLDSMNSKIASCVSGSKS